MFSRQSCINIWDAKGPQRITTELCAVWRTIEYSICRVVTRLWTPIINLGFLLIEQLLTKYIYISQEAMHGDCIHCKAIVQKYLQMSL